MPAVERSKVIASLPSLSLLTLAALTPRDVEVSYREVPDLAAEADPVRNCDLVAISSYSAQIDDAYRLAGLYRERGIPVVVGGPHVTARPDEARARGLTAVAGEGELSWERVLTDFSRGRLAPEYRPPEASTDDLALAPIPRFELLEMERYNRITVQTSRGCPHRCEFCASSVLLSPRYKTKPVAKIIAEIRRIKELWPHPFIEFADDNSFVTRSHAKELLTALKTENVKWFTEADVSIAGDPELLDLMRESGCRQVLIGLESPDEEELDGIEMKSNWKRHRVGDYEAAIRTIQSHGVTVNGCFVLGLDGQDETIFDRVYEFVERSGLYEVQITALTPFPGTPLHERLRVEGRLLAEGAWERCTLFDVNFIPTGMSPERLQAGLVDLGRRLYDKNFIEARRARFFRDLRASRSARGNPKPEGQPHDA